MADIVERLREQGKLFDGMSEEHLRHHYEEIRSQGLKHALLANVLHGAADEIAQLRAEVTRLTSYRDGLDKTVLELEAKLEWQPIETAPKDGTEIDLWVQSNNGPLAWREPDCHFHCDEWLQWGGDPEIGWVKIGLEPQCTPTHWRPLPAPPSGEHSNG